MSAIGHEQDHPLVDLVADVRAGTPSLAANLIVPDHKAEAAALDALLARATRALEGGCARSRKLLELLVMRPAFNDPGTWIAVRRKPARPARGVDPPGRGRSGGAGAIEPRSRA